MNMSEPYEPRNPNTKLYLLFRRFQEWSPIITVAVSCLALVIIGFQACIYWKQTSVMEKTLTVTAQATQLAKEARRPIVIQDVTLAKVTDQMEFEIRLHNDGGSPADATLKYCLVPSQSPNINPTFSNCFDITTKGPILVTLGSPQTLTVRLWNKAWVQLIRERPLYLFIMTAVSYEDFDGHRERVKCSVYREDFLGVGDCSDFIDTKTINPSFGKSPN